MKFKVGDRVVIYDYEGPKSKKLTKGTVGIVVHNDTPDFFPVKVKFDNDDEIFYEKELRHCTKLDEALK